MPERISSWTAVMAMLTVRERFSLLAFFFKNSFNKQVKNLPKAACPREITRSSLLIRIQGTQTHFHISIAPCFTAPPPTIYSYTCAIFMPTPPLRRMEPPLCALSFFSKLSLTLIESQLPFSKNLASFILQSFNNDILNGN